MPGTEGGDDGTIDGDAHRTPEFGIGLLLRNQQVRRLTASYVGENGLAVQQYLAGQLELELVPQVIATATMPPLLMMV